MQVALRNIVAQLEGVGETFATLFSGYIDSIVGYESRSTLH
jgi:hypothetical protein